MKVLLCYADPPLKLQQLPEWKILHLVHLVRSMVKEVNQLLLHPDHFGEEMVE